MSNPDRIVTPTTSKLTIDGVDKTFQSFQVDVDMGTQVGTNYKKTTSKTSLRIIINHEGHVISAYPK